MVHLIFALFNSKTQANPRAFSTFLSRACGVKLSDSDLTATFMSVRQSDVSVQRLMHSQDTVKRLLIFQKGFGSRKKNIADAPLIVISLYLVCAPNFFPG